MRSMAKSSDGFYKKKSIETMILTTNSNFNNKSNQIINVKIHSIQSKLTVNDILFHYEYV